MLVQTPCHSWLQATAAGAGGGGGWPACANDDHGGNRETGDYFSSIPAPFTGSR